MYMLAGLYTQSPGPYNICITFLYGGLPYNQLRGHVIHVYMYSQVCDYMMYGGPYMGVLWHTSYMGEFYITWRNARMAEDPGASRHFHSSLCDDACGHALPNLRPFSPPLPQLNLLRTYKLPMYPPAWFTYTRSWPSRNLCGVRQTSFRRRHHYRTQMSCRIPKTVKLSLVWQCHSYDACTVSGSRNRPKAKQRKSCPEKLPSASTPFQIMPVMLFAATQLIAYGQVAR